jgi:hypothetical protein
MSKNRIGGIIILLQFFLAISLFGYLTPPLIDFQGRLTSNDNVPRTGVANLTFEIYAAQTGGSALWSEVQNPVIVTNGIFNVFLGSNTPLGSSLFENADNRWLQITVDGELLTPRVRLVTSAFSFISERSYGIIGATVTSANIVNNTIMRNNIANDVGTTTIVTNLNADLLDGNHSSVFAPLASPGFSGNVVVAGKTTIDWETTSGTSNGFQMCAGDGTAPRSQSMYLLVKHVPNTSCDIVVGRNGTGDYAYARDSTGWKAGCSRTIKDDIQQLTSEDYAGALAQFMSTPLFKYKRNDVPDKEEIGYISEETPEMIGSDGYGISTSKTVGYLSAVVKAQQLKIQELENKIDILMNK